MSKCTGQKVAIRIFFFVGFVYTGRFMLEFASGKNLAYLKELSKFTIGSMCSEDLSLELKSVIEFNISVSLV